MTFTGFKPFAVIWLRGPDGNLFAIREKCMRGAKAAGKSEEEIESFSEALLSTHSYADALAVVREWFNATIHGDPDD